MLRVLARRGQLAVAVWDSLENIPGYAAEVALLERRAGREAADAVRTPFALGDRSQLAALFESAGTDSVEVGTQHGTARFPSVRAMLEADLRGWLPVMGVVLSEEQIEQILAEAEHALSPYRSEDGRAGFAAPAHVVTATKR